MSGMTWIPDIVASLGDHLWQSTLVVLAVAVLTLAFRRNHARVRYALWLVASLKFLVPFGALVALGQQFGQQFGWARTFRVMRIDRVVALDGQMPSLPGGPAIRLPFQSDGPIFGMRVPVPDAASSEVWMTILPVALGVVWVVGAATVLAVWWMRSRRVARIAAGGTVLAEGREVEMLRRMERLSGVKRPLPLVATDTSLEPGVFGMWRPVLLWPRSIGGHLTDDQIEAIFAHEIAHVRRRDNLGAALQAVVQAIFWFHPLVWWMGARLVDERERACDEDVIRLGSRPHVYAESILRTCQFYVEAPVACVAGVTGSDLKRRIEQIMRNRPSEPMGFWRKGFLAAAGTMTLVVPIVFGAFNAPVEAQVRLARADTARQIVLHLKLNTHVEKRRFPAYALVRAADTLGPQLKPSGGNCTTAPATGVLGVAPCDLRRQFEGFPKPVGSRQWAVDRP